MQTVEFKKAWRDRLDPLNVVEYEAGKTYTVTNAVEKAARVDGVLAGPAPHEASDKPAG